MYAHILMPVSLDKGVDLAPKLAVAQQLAGETGRVTLLHVMEEIPEYATTYLPFGYQDETRAQIEAALTEIGGSPSVDGIVLHGKPNKVIPQFVQSKGVDCVILSLASEPGRELKSIEAIAQLLRQVSCAVHILR
jgi:nucleotide-binding universal stress UspA family protein